MKMGLPAFVLVNVAMILLVVAGVLAVGWFLLSTNLDQTEVKHRAEFSRLNASAVVYQDRLGSYEGLCADIGVPDKFRCTESAAAYAIETDLGAGSFYCIDSAGFAGKTRIPKGTGTVCRR